MARSMGGSEREVGAQKIGARRTRTETGAVVVKRLNKLFVEQIVHVEAEGRVLAERVARDEIEKPVTRHLARDVGRVVVTSRHLVGILETAADRRAGSREPVTGEEIGRPFGDEWEPGAGRVA